MHNRASFNADSSKPEGDKKKGEQPKGGDPNKPKNKRYRKDKPWDDETIDHWKIEPCALVSASEWYNAAIAIAA